ncbi:MAG: membrane dipeptidase, partial [Bacteroidetes bacterium]|nr:membrane dipeptidase [Bacteroidota bacterium]
RDLSKGLTPFGENVVERMIELGMIVDLTHSTPLARDRVFDINNNRHPLVFSHVGVHAIADYPMNPTDDEIGKVAACGGVVGIIFKNFWLKRNAGKDGLELIGQTASHIQDVGGIETVAIGTDFDGFTDPPDDAKDMADIPRVRDYLLGTGFSQSDVEKILGGNAVRVLNDGWGK